MSDQTFRVSEMNLEKLVNNCMQFICLYSSNI